MAKEKEQQPKPAPGIIEGMSREEVTEQLKAFLAERPDATPSIIFHDFQREKPFWVVITVKA